MLLREIKESDMEKIGRLFTSGPGKEVLNVLSMVFYDTISFTPNSPDVSAFREGQRDLVQIIRTAVKTVEQKETK